MSIIDSLYRFVLKQEKKSDLASQLPKTDWNRGSTLEETLREFSDCDDLVHRTLPELQMDIVYLIHLVGSDNLYHEITVPFTDLEQDEAITRLQYAPFKEASSLGSIIMGMLEGDAALFVRGRAYLISLSKPPNRSIQQSETETVITGPHDAFVETATVNLSLIRRRVRSSHLKIVKLQVGEVTKTDVYILYIQDLVNPEYVNEMRSRISNIEIDAVHDGNMLAQYIDDHPNAIFPLYQTTERIDSTVSKLVGGRVLVIMDGSPSAITAPSSFFEFFTSPDDYYQRWMLGSAIRLLRFLAFIITISFTALYVSLTTFHYEMIPESLLLTLTQSRSEVPFPPLYEALFLEITIELLREAGARLPSKIGQTIGIVGGIVIGQAAVQASLTSNVLIIAVASSAIASFVIPSYVMSASIRLMRFGLILLAGLLGNFGLMAGVAFLIIHLAGLTSLGSSYMTPIAPQNFQDWKDVFIRAPFSMLKTRASITMTPNRVRNKMRK
ncbi:spore germination protein [Paenibacillus sp. GCM10023252]|uniref:spore germination protein n=1 Tax=Paenibacillus sp. GCM10023252 TaxID=3252649 RepID=UPI00360918E6